MNLLIQKYDQIKLYILVAIVAFLPYYLQISNTLIVMAVALTILRMIYLRSWNFRQLNIVPLTFIGYFILEAIGLLYTTPENLKEGFFVLEKHQAFILMPFIFSDFQIDIKKREFVFVTFVLSCIAGVIVCVIVNMYQGITLYDQYFHEWLFSHDRFSEPIGLQAFYFSLYIGFAILILINFYFEGITIFPKMEKKDFSGIEKDSIGLLLLIFFIVLITLGSRTIIVSLVLVALTYLLTYAISKNNYKAFVIAAIIPVILIGFVFINPVVKARFLDLRYNQYKDSNYGSYFARLDIWQPGIDAIKDNIWFGVGTGDHQTELTKKYSEYGYSEGVRLAFNMHNQYLQTMLSYGILGLLILVCIFVVQASQAIRNKDWLCLTFIGLFMLASITESTLFRNKGIIFFLIFSFIFLKSKTTSETKV